MTQKKKDRKRLYALCEHAMRVAYAHDNIAEIRPMVSIFDGYEKNTRYNKKFNKIILTAQLVIRGISFGMYETVESMLKEFKEGYEECSETSLKSIIERFDILRNILNNTRNLLRN